MHDIKINTKMCMFSSEPLLLMTIIMATGQVFSTPFWGKETGPLDVLDVILQCSFCHLTRIFMQYYYDNSGILMSECVIYTCSKPTQGFFLGSDNVDIVVLPLVWFSDLL